MPPILTVSFRFLQPVARLRRHQRSIEDLELGAGSPLPDCFTGVLLQTTDRAHAREQLQIMCQRRRIASVLQLPKNLGIRQNLTGISASQLEQSAQHYRVVHTRLQQNIAGNRRFE
jgi:hypothetical protein